MHATIERLEPQTAAEAATLMRECAGAGKRLAFVGGGTHTIGRPNAVDAMLSTRGLRRVVEYAPEDQTVTVEAGVTISELAEVLAVHGQRLVLDVAEPQRATVGGAVAANAFGPRRMRFGSLKDLILGVTLVRADGVASRAGGKVVKNVAGFDLSKLVVGSHGTLALITSATLRVHPLPQAARAARVAHLNAESVWSLVLALRERALEAVAVNATRRTDGSTPTDSSSTHDVDVVFEGFRAGVDAQIETLFALATEYRWTAEEIAPEIACQADARVRTGGPLRVRCTMLPSEFASNQERAIRPLLGALGAPIANAYPALGIVTVAGTPNGTSESNAMNAVNGTNSTWGVVAEARAHLERRGGSLVVESMPQNGGPAIDPWGTAPPSFALMRELKSRFDPDARLAPGAFVGGL